MFVTIWMCTQEWSLICEADDGVHVRHVPPRLDLRVGVDALDARGGASGSRATGTRSCIGRDRLGRA